MTTHTDTAVRRSISVRAAVERAFQAFTAGMEGWWPHDHHIGKVGPGRRQADHSPLGDQAGSIHREEYNSDYETCNSDMLVFVLRWICSGDSHSPEPHPPCSAAPSV